MEIKKLLSQLKRFEKYYEDVNEETIEDTVDVAEAPEMKTEIDDDMSIADKLAAKTKIAKSLEDLQLAIDDFKDASLEKLDLLNDEGLLSAIEGLDLAVTAIEQALNPEDVVAADGGTGLNAAFSDELPDEPADEDEDTIEDEEDTIEDEEDEDSFDTEDVDFDDEAGLDLLGGEEAGLEESFRPRRRRRK